MATKALVIGGTGGIGYAIAARIASQSSSSTVTVSGRSKPSEDAHPNIQFRPLDASSMRSIKHYTDDYKLQPQSLDLLVLTQGILTTAGRTETPEGIDYKMALHYYGRQLLIRELLPALKDDAKVLIVLDSVRGNPAKLNWEDLDLKSNFSLANAGNHCMAMTDAMVQAYAAEQQETKTAKRHFIHAFPGFVSTNIFQTLPWYLRPASRAVTHLFGVAPDKCAENLLKGVDESAAAGEASGTYWSCIDDKGSLITSKPVWGQEEIKKVQEHTWKIVDETLDKAP